MASSAVGPLLFDFSPVIHSQLKFPATHRASPVHSALNRYLIHDIKISRYHVQSRHMRAHRHVLQSRHRGESRAAAMMRDTQTSENGHGENAVEDLPVIDMGKLRREGDARKEVVEEIGIACEEWGFFHVVNHGVPGKIIEDMWKAYRAIISYSNEVPPKERTRMATAIFPSELREMLLSNMDAIFKFDLLSSRRATVQLSKFNPEDGEASPALESIPWSFRAPVCEFYRALMNVGLELMEAISESLGMPLDSIYTITGRNGVIGSAMHYYKPIPNTSTEGLTPQKDPVTITILLPDPHVGSLQVLKEERWVDVKPVQGSLVINLGDFMEAMTNGKYKSSFHRAMSNGEESRSSIACFMRPAPETIVGPLPKFVDEQNPAKYACKSAEELLSELPLQITY